MMRWAKHAQPLPPSKCIAIPTHTRWLRRDDLDRAQRRAGLSRDLAISRDVLQDKLGEVSDTLCWPYGDFDQDHIEVAREQGFRYLHHPPVRPQRGRR